MAQKKVRIPRRVVVPAVRIAKGRIQRVIFKHNPQKHRFVAVTAGCPLIRVEFREEDGKFHAFSGAVDIADRHADKAFAKATKRLWI